MGKNLNNDTEQRQVDAHYYIPDLTYLRERAIEQSEQGVLKLHEKQQILDALEVLKKNEYCQLKFGI